MQKFSNWHIIILMPLINWAKNNKLSVFLALIVIIFLLTVKNNFLGTRPQYSLPQKGLDTTEVGSQGAVGLQQPSLRRGFEPVSQTSERIVIQNSNLSLVVQDVRKVGDEIVNYAKSVGGFMVSTSYNRPTDAPFATITVRVPTDKLNEALEHFRSLSYKVASENLVGEDVTDEYLDIDSRLTTLQKTKDKFEQILEKATSVEDILNVQRELINLQDEIDSLKGQKEALAKNAQLTKVTVYLSTDELALPYKPDKVFRPQVIFKQAVRSLLSTARVLAELGIWIVVYAPVWIIPVVAYYLIRKRKQKKGQISKAES